MDSPEGITCGPTVVDDFFFLLTSGEVVQHSDRAGPAYSGGQEVWTAPIPSATEESGRSHTSARYGSPVVGVFVMPLCV